MKVNLSIKDFYTYMDIFRVQRLGYDSLRTTLWVLMEDPNNGPKIYQKTGAVHEPPFKGHHWINGLWVVLVG